jgi:hypothetical protein
MPIDRTASTFPSSDSMLPIGLFLTLLLITPSAFAALGGSEASVQADQARLMATLRSTDTRAYTIHELTTPTGIVIRQYVSSAGRVFGVAWQGPFMPDLSQLLGSYFARFSSAAKSKRAPRASRNHLVIADHGLVLESTGHMRDYSGHAYDPDLLPEGVHGYDVR